MPGYSRSFLLALVLAFGAFTQASAAERDRIDLQDTKAVLIRHYFLNSPFAAVALITDPAKIKELADAFADGGGPAHDCIDQWLISFRTKALAPEIFPYNEVCTADDNKDRHKLLSQYFQTIRDRPKAFGLSLVIRANAEPEDVAKRLDDGGHPAFFLNGTNARLPSLTLSACVNSSMLNVKRTARNFDETDRQLEQLARQNLNLAKTMLAARYPVVSSTEPGSLRAESGPELRVVCMDSSFALAYGTDPRDLDGLAPGIEVRKPVRQPAPYTVQIAIEQRLTKEIRARLLSKYPFIIDMHE